MKRDDRGAAIVLLALTMVVLLTMAALAIDYGAITNERRLAQTAADSAALAGGGQLLASKTRSVAAEEVIAATADNLGVEVDLAQWASCTDPDRPAGYTASTVSPCISFNAFNTRIRVRVPQQIVQTQFARVIGVNDMETSAFAEVELVPTGFGRLLPFGMPTAEASSTVLCLKTGPGGKDDTPPCDGPTTGNFGSMDISLFGNPALGTPEICGDTDPNTKLPANIILGTDHPLDEWSESPNDPLDTFVGGMEVIRDDHTLCPDLGARPNQLWSQSGLRSQQLDGGLIEGMTLDGKELSGRLTLSPATDRRAVRVGSPDLDNRPLWEFIPTTTVVGVPDSCQRSAFAGATANKAQMQLCIEEYVATSSTANLFTEDREPDGQLDILQTPRFGFVPLFHEETFLSGNSDPYRIQRFLPIFLQTVYFASPPHGCDGIFNPGELVCVVLAEKKVEALTAFLLPTSTLPPVALSMAPGGIVTKDLGLRR